MTFETPRDLHDLPKAELHIHLEGAVRPATMEEFCARKGITPPGAFRDFDHFIESFTAVWPAMDRPGDYARMVREYCEDARACGIRYAELQLATAFRPYDCLAEAVEAAEREPDIALRFIIDVPRALPVEVGWRMFEAAHGVPQVVAIGLAGNEDGYPGEPFVPLIEAARAAGLRSVPHAGEVTGAEFVREALDMLGADRIQHGISAARDRDLLDELARRRIPLAVCPTSNALLGAVPSLEAHPLRAFWDAGVSVSVNTDDPGYFGCTLTGEYAIAGRLLDLDRAGYARLARNSVEGSFAPAALKAELDAGIDDWERRGG
ncbi:MAG TPA: adenosine deaminase [Dehalococcoidia bacterium]|jgi:adenosine deaminase|nr:adenosine deaminase [Dehalococcoidia bacterium]